MRLPGGAPAARIEPRSNDNDESRQGLIVVVVPFQIVEVQLAEKIREGAEIGLFEARPGLGAFSAKDVIMMEQRPIVNGTQEIVIHTARKPAFAGVDPYNFYIDRNSDDNVKDVTS